MLVHENRLLAYFFRKLRKMSQNLSSVAVVIGVLRAKIFAFYYFFSLTSIKGTCKDNYNYENNRY